MLGACLSSLARDEVIAEAGTDAFRFAHLLIRDVTYEGMLKQRRAELHERFADWLEARRPAGRGQAARARHGTAPGGRSRRDRGGDQPPCVSELNDRSHVLRYGFMTPRTSADASWNASVHT